MLIPGGGVKNVLCNTNIVIDKHNRINLSLTARLQSPDFYANLQTGFVGRFEDKVGRFDRISCALCFELGNTFPLTKSVLQNYK